MEAKILEVLNQWDLSCAEEPQLKKDLAKQIADTLTHQPNNSDKEFTTQNHFYNQPNNSGEEQKLFVEMKIWDGSSYLMARCPDEDEQMSITVKDRYKSIFSLSLEQAKDLAEYLLSHVDNAIKANT